MLNNIRIVLVNTSHPGNIGAAARAMKTMGLYRLYLVSPKCFPDKKATIRAAGADDILNQAIVTENLEIALQDCQWVYASSARARRLEWPECNPRQCAQKIIQEQSQQEIAIVFGRESSGLTNEEMAHCHFSVSIPAEKQFSSLNLAAAVQVFSYELHMASLLHSAGSQKRTIATHEKVQGLISHWEATAIQLACLDPQHPRRMMQRISRLFKRAQPDNVEINILRGFLSAMNKNFR